MMSAEKNLIPDPDPPTSDGKQGPPPEIENNGEKQNGESGAAADKQKHAAPGDCQESNKGQTPEAIKSNQSVGGNAKVGQSIGAIKADRFKNKNKTVYENNTVSKHKHISKDQNITIERFVLAYIGGQGESLEKAFGGSKAKPAETQEPASENPDDEMGDDKEKSLSSVTEHLPPPSPDLFGLVPENLDTKIRELRRYNIIFIGCADGEIARAIADAIFDGLCINNHNKRYLGFDSNSIAPAEDLINLFTSARRDSQSETAVFVDMSSESAEPFLDSLINGIKSRSFESALSRNRYFIISFIKPKQMENRSKDLNYPYWEVGCLKYLLGSRYAYLEQRIHDQRSRGIWANDDEEFCQEIKSFIRNGQFVAQVESLESSDAETPLCSLFKGGSGASANDLISDTVLYTAAFYPALNPGDFRQVVSSLLGERTITVKTTLHRQEAGESVEAQKEEPLRPIWQNNSDKLLKDCSLKIFSAKDAGKTIHFSKPGLKEQLKVYIEEEHSFFLEDQFQNTRKQGLLFHTSSDVREGVCRLVVEMTLSYRDHFDQHWLIEIIKKLKQAVLQEQVNWETEFPELLPFKKIQGNRLEWCYMRISELLRKMLEHSQLKGLVDEFLNRLMGVNYHDSVLQIIKRLQFAPEFNIFYWARQLMDRGLPAVRLQTRRFLIQYLKRLGPNVYKALGVMQQWLPSPNNEPSAYNPANLRPLELMFQYCLETTSHFDMKYYGLQPSVYPLFSCDDLSVIEDNSKLLAEWLFHPGMKVVLKTDDDSNDDDSNDDDLMIATLIVNWVFILLAPNKDTTIAQSGTTTIEEALNLAQRAKNNRDLTISNGLILGLFFRAVATAIKQPQLDGIYECWAAIAEIMSESIKDLPYKGNQRQDAICIRNLVRDMARQFKGFVRNVKSQVS